MYNRNCILVPVDCHILVNNNITEYNNEINELLKSENTNIDNIEIQENGCGRMNENNQAILKLKITFNVKTISPVDYLTKILSTINKYGVGVVKPNCLNNCPNIQFLNNRPLPLSDTFILENANNDHKEKWNLIFKNYETKFKQLDVINESGFKGVNKSQKSTIVIIKLIFDYYKENNKDILSYESLITILKKTIFKKLTRESNVMLMPELEDLRKLAILKLSLVNYRLIEQFKIKYLNNDTLDTGLLYSHWKTNHNTISRTKLLDLLQISNYKDKIEFWIKTRNQIINYVLTEISNININGKSKVDIVLFLIFGDYGIESAIQIN